MMKWLSILVLWCGVSIGATFTDVTIEGTPYLTTNVLSELQASYLSRGASWDTSPQYNSLSRHLDPDFPEGVIIDRGNYTALYGYRQIAASYWAGGWINQLPTNSFASIDALAYTNQVAYFVAAGLSSNGWRNATNYNPAVNDWRDFDDPMYIYRTNASGFAPNIEVGDILGPWIIDDLQLAFDHAQYKIDGSWRAQPMATNSYSGGGYDSNLADAKTAAIADFGSSGNWSGIYAWGSVCYNPIHNHYTANLKNVTGIFFDFTRYVTPSSGSGIRTNSPLQHFGGEIYGYLYATAPGTITEFDSFGYNVVESNFTLVATMPIAQGTVTNSVILEEAFGDPATLPGFPAGTPPSWSTIYRGFKTEDNAVIYKVNHPFTR
jgi:hypothetical protein